MASQPLRRAAFAACIVVALLGLGGTARAAPARSSYYPNWDGNGCRNIVPSQIEWQCQAGAAMTTTTNQQYVYESVTLSVSTIGHYAPWSGSLQIIDVADSSQDCVVSIPAAAGTWECDISGAIGSELDIQLATSSPGVEIVQLAFAPLNQPTATPTDTATATGQPTDTPTNTVVPGSTSTPIPTNTPRPVKTAISTTTPTATNLPTLTPGPTMRACGLGFQNCDFIGNPPAYWYDSGLPAGAGGFGGRPPTGPGCMNNQCPANAGIWQQSIMPADGNPCYTITYGNPTNWIGGDSAGSGGLVPTSVFLPAFPSGYGGYSFNSGGFTGATFSGCYGSNVAAGTPITFYLSSGNEAYPITALSFSAVWSGPSPTPLPATPTNTALPGPPTDTPLPLPFDTGTAIATGTPCPGGCAVGEATSLPGAVDTVLPIDTSPLSPLEHLSVSRTACQTFGSAPILVPSIHGTPVFGSTQPLSITWSLPVTGTTFTPCADPAFATTWWDLTWHLSIIVTFIAFLSWLIWYVRRLFT